MCFPLGLWLSHNSYYDLVQTDPATIVAEWVKGHYVGSYHEYKQDLNDGVDRLATQFNKHPTEIHKQQRIPCPFPNYTIWLLYDRSTITTKLYHILSMALHQKDLISYHNKKSDRTDSVFNIIQWDADEWAFKSRQEATKLWWWN